MNRTYPPLPLTARDDSQPRLTRRSFLGAGAAAGLALAAPPAFARAAVPFGGAIQHEHFDDAAYRQAFLDHCDIVMPMNELKFGLVQWERGVFDFSRADRLVDFARDNGKTSRGHAFVWWSTNPPWLDALADAREAEAVLIEHIERTADHFRGRLTDWDVVNEVIANEPRGHEGGPLRDTVWRRLLGARHIPLAFEALARTDPSAGCVINDYDLEFAGERYDARRRVMLDIVRQLQDAGLRVDTVGLQAHLYAHYQIDVEGLARFKEELGRLGVDVIVTELDVIQYGIDGGPEEQDEAAGRVVSDLMDAVLPGPPPRAVVAWGLTDRYTWVDDVMPREDGTPSRPHPLDAQMREKPWFGELRRRLAQGA